MDHSRIPNDDDWRRELDELEDLIAALRKHSPQARHRAKEKVRDGYPTRSPGADAASGGGSGGGGSSDPTGDHVVKVAGGQFTEATGDTTPDTWRGVHDPVGYNVRMMIRATHDARNHLRGATAAMRRALPAVIEEPVREVCVTCGTSKKVAGRWVQAEGRCGACSTRLKRQGAKAGVA